MSVNKTKITNSLPYALLAFIAVCLLLSGCLAEPTKLSQNKVQVQQEKFTDNVAVASLNDAAIKGLADHYRRHGDGPLDLTVTYDPKSKSSGAMRASDEAARLAGSMRGYGINNVRANIVPVHNSGGDMRALMSYMAYDALAPKDCSLMAGVDNRDISVEEDYKLGCSTETLFARQIARPKDLKGQGSGDTTDGRRSANIVEGYRTGVPNDSLGGESATQ